MARVVCIHGIGQQHAGESQLASAWHTALADGLLRADSPLTLKPDDLRCVFYGDLFRPPGRTLAVGDPPLDASDIEEGFETELLLAWWQEAARTDPAGLPATARSCSTGSTDRRRTTPRGFPTSPPTPPPLHAYRSVSSSEQAPSPREDPCPAPPYASARSARPPAA
ncbi:hypothetical protein [Streptomyces sp. RG80]|uniref:hypothetical protein n=1 Tax=Streptomyces sp. RG80 TaxID=3157340 RepID=UPI00338F0F69